MKKKRTSDVAKSSNIDESHPGKRNCSMISSRLREKGHRMLPNHQTLTNLILLREIVQWSDLDEEKKDIGCCQIIKHWRISSLWEKLFNDLISMKRKRTSDVAKSSNIDESHPAKRNCSMIWSRWREKGHRMLPNHQTLPNLMILREIVHDLISMKRKRTSDVAKSSNIDESHHLERNCSMISFRWREKGHLMLPNHQTLTNVMMMREIVQWSHPDEEKKDIGCCQIIKHWRTSSC